jgi:hypothetical protein
MRIRYRTVNMGIDHKHVNFFWICGLYISSYKHVGVAKVWYHVGLISKDLILYWWHDA